MQSFLDRAASLSTLTASHRDNLSLAVARLPGLLAAAQPSLQQLDTVAATVRRWLRSCTLRCRR